MKKTHHVQIARLGQALASPVRLRALNLLAQRAWKVGELATELGESLAATSAHLKVLKAAGMVVDEKQGREVWCRVESEEVLQLFVAAQRAAEAVLPELREAARTADEDPFLWRGESLDEVASESGRGRITLVDLRPSDEYQAGHLPGAESWPFPTLEEADLRPLRGTRPVIGYCRGPWCAMAREGVNLLNRRGVPAQRLRAGIVEWRAEGFEITPADASPGAASPGDASPGDASPGDASPGATSPGATSPGATSPGATSPGATSSSATSSSAAPSTNAPAAGAAAAGAAAKQTGTAKPGGGKRRS